jgi:hypothetical protein
LFRLYRYLRRAAQPQQAKAPPPAWQSLIPPTFRLATFGAIACYVELLVAEGHGLVGAVAAAVTTAVGAWVSTAPGPFGPSARATA